MMVMMVMMVVMMMVVMMVVMGARPSRSVYNSNEMYLMVMSWNSFMKTQRRTIVSWP